MFFNGSLSNIRAAVWALAFTNDMPLAVSKASVSMYSDDSTLSTLYTSVTTATEVPATLKKEQQLV
jgi:hypothetical protein